MPRWERAKWEENTRNEQPSWLWLSRSCCWSSLQVDFLVVSKHADGALGVSLVDPHGAHLADALPKLQGLARFARNHGDQFVRIESIAEIGGVLRVLDLQREDVRAAVESFAGAQATPLYEDSVAATYG